MGRSCRFAVSTMQMKSVSDFRAGILKEVYTMIWAKEETLPSDEIEAIQLAKLKGTVRYINERVKPYLEK